jgi:cytochrome c biogenesis protein CcmG/thiol:disulfide interchange protein DsbE
MLAERNDRSRRSLWARLVALAAVFLVVALLAYGLATQAPDTGIDQALSKSEPADAPPFDLPVLQRGELGAPLARYLQPALADGRVSLAELEGRPTVLNFWASWCVPCRTEAPILEQAWKRAASHGVLFVGLNMQDLTGDARRFMDEFEVSYLNIRDQSNGVATEWGATGLPETFFLSREGKVVGHVVGAISKRRLREGIAAAADGRPLGSIQGGDRRSTR